jgi:hypothetical protein
MLFFLNSTTILTTNEKNSIQIILILILNQESNPHIITRANRQ